MFLELKKFLGPPLKSKKNDFLKKPKFCDLSEHGGVVKAVAPATLTVSDLLE